MNSAPIRNQALERSAGAALRRIFGFIAFYSLLILCGLMVLIAACGLTSLTSQKSCTQTLWSF